MYNPCLLTSSISETSIIKFSYFVAILCLMMIVINILFIRDIIKKLIAKDSDIRFHKKVFYVIYMGVIVFISFFLIFLSIKCCSL